MKSLTSVVMVSFLFAMTSRKNFISSCKYYIVITFLPWFYSNSLAVQFVSTWQVTFLSILTSNNLYLFIYGFWASMFNMSQYAQFESICSIWVNMLNMSQYAEYESMWSIWVNILNMSQMLNLNQYAQYESICSIWVNMLNISQYACLFLSVSKTISCCIFFAFLLALSKG